MICASSFQFCTWLDWNFSFSAVELCLRFLLYKCLLGSLYPLSSAIGFINLSWFLTIVYKTLNHSIPNWGWHLICSHSDLCFDSYNLKMLVPFLASVLFPNFSGDIHNCNTGLCSNFPHPVSLLMWAPTAYWTVLQTPLVLVSDFGWYLSWTHTESCLYFPVSTNCNVLLSPVTGGIQAASALISVSVSILLDLGCNPIKLYFISAFSLGVILNPSFPVISRRQPG